jgi:competence protein ComEC
MFSRKQRIFVVLLAVFLLLFGVIWAKTDKNGSRLEVVFFDVGQGDAALIKSPYGQNILIDGGPDNTVIRRLSEELPFWERRIDLMVLTHPHDDHLFGLNEVLERYRVDQALYSGAGVNNQAFHNWLAGLKNQEAKLLVAERGDRIRLGPECGLDVIYPDHIPVASDNLNDTSVVLRLDCLGKRFLFTGDIEEKAELEILAEDLDLQADYLKVAHHGSDTSSQAEFLDQVKPKVAFVPVGADNSFGLPSERILLRLKRSGAKVHRADKEGNLKVVVGLDE